MDPLQNDIMTQFGFDKLPEAEQTEMYQKIGTVLFQAILVRALEEMTDEQPDDPGALAQYLQANVPNFEELAADEVARFRASAMEIMQGPIA
jgi:hypothetical protein